MQYAETTDMLCYTVKWGSLFDFQFQIKGWFTTAVYDGSFVKGIFCILSSAQGFFSPKKKKYLNVYYYLLLWGVNKCRKWLSLNSSYVFHRELISFLIYHIYERSKTSQLAAWRLTNWTCLTWVSFTLNSMTNNIPSR